MKFMSEADVEQARLDLLREMGYAVVHGDDIGPDSKNPERISYSDVILQARFEQALIKLNPGLPQVVLDEAKRLVVDSVFPDLMEENRRIHHLLVEGVDIQYQGANGLPANARVRYFDFETVDNNDWLAVNQFTVIENGVERKADVVIFVNGLPIAVDELKNPQDKDATAESAFYQLQTYKREIPSLFRTNAVLVVSDGMLARVGSLSANYERFVPWREEDGYTHEAELLTMTQGLFAKMQLLDVMSNFTMFHKNNGGLVKIVAGYHQYHGARLAMNSTIKASAVHGDRKGGVVWHTQGSGKSLLMVFYAALLSKSHHMLNPTVIILTDRTDLDGQLFTTFSKSVSHLRQTPVQAQSRTDLRDQLNRAAGGIIFTTLQKYEETITAICDRSNVVVVADEAHRSQYGFEARINEKTGEITYGFAKHLRDALPNATFIGFTGTPIEKQDANTKSVFGEYVHVYDISQAVEDGNTVPIHYESRVVSIKMDESDLDALDEEIEALTVGLDEDSRERVKQKWATVEALAGSDLRVQTIAADLVNHFEQRQAALKGKAMFVAMSRAICVKIHDEIKKLRPDWYSSDDGKGSVKVVMTGSASDPTAWQEHIGNARRREVLDARAKDPSDPLNLVIVCDMWLTGFDSPSMHTLYLDKPMQGHTLMQAIARVNRVFKDKPAGLVVDYIGVAQSLREALGHYSKQDQNNTGIVQAMVIQAMREHHHIVQTMFHGFDYMSGLNGTASERLSMMARATNWILRYQLEQSSKEVLPEAKKRAQRRFQDAVLRLGKSYAMAVVSDEARAIRDEVGFFQAICGIIEKGKTHSSGASARERGGAVQQIISRAVVSTEIVDLLGIDGVENRDISILSDDFLDELRKSNEPYLASEALRRLLNESIMSRGKKNVVQAKAFSERLKEAMSRYHANVIGARQVIDELIAIAKDIRKAKEQGQELGLSDDEIAFYDALADNESAVEALGDEKLRLIAHEVMTKLRNNVTVDWAKRASARAKMRLLVKKILRKYGYPPDMEDAAVQTVLKQAEVLLVELTR